MKVCIVNFNVYCLFDPKSSAPMGGAELDMYTVALSLREFFDIYVVTGDWGQQRIEKRNGISIYKSFSLEKKFLNYLRAPFAFWNSLKKVNADVYISSGAGPEVGILSLFCKVNKKKFIYRTAHIIDCNGVYAKSNGLSGLVYEYGLRHVSRVVTSVNQHKQVLIERYPALRGLVSHINLGIYDLNAGRMDRGFVLWVARCEKWKRPDIFLKLAANFPSSNFLMICPKQKHNPGYFEEIKEKATLLPNVTFIDFVLFKDIQPYFDRAKIFVNTSDFEGFTYTIVQSGLAKTPIVYLNVNPDSVITNNNIGYCADGDFDRMIEQIQKLLSDEKDWEERSEKVFRYVKENHDMKIIGGQWRELLQSLLKN